ncbi:MAG: transcription antitermination factor NusB [Alphaproteobacteria bacterium]|nr:transcription antitermination factor NusB [Alphaproteobacteria bacterium]
MKKFTKRRAARFFAVQALYQREHSDQPLRFIMNEFARDHLNNPEHDLATDSDEALFEMLVQGVQDHQEVIDAQIKEMLQEGWALERLDAVIRAILRASTYEVMFMLETPLAVIINEYLEISKTFFAQGEVNFVHVAMDKIGILVRGKTS